MDSQSGEVNIDNSKTLNTSFSVGGLWVAEMGLLGRDPAVFLRLAESRLAEHRLSYQ